MLHKLRQAVFVLRDWDMLARTEFVRQRRVIRAKEDGHERRGRQAAILQQP